MEFYPWIKTLHVFFAIVAVGANITYGVWMARAAKEPQHAGYALRGIKFIDDRIANPAYIGLLVLGILLVLGGPWEFEQLWVAAALALYVVMGAVAFILYSPTLSKLITSYETGGADTDEFRSLSARSRTLGIVLAVIVVVIIVLMVVKPG
ncbi:MAG: DUF2269 domain-containing protein [Chloroflexi bacterium]|nr:DUF2269 domain-containing protein [Chloroflexota bacterium]